MRTPKRLISKMIPVWLHRKHPDPRHFHGRRLTGHYQRRRSMVKNFWIVAGLAMIVVPLAHVAVGISLFTTFLSFMYLDEAPDLADQWS